MADFDAFGVRADFFPSTSAETSNVQRTRRPFWSGGILIARFDTMIVRGQDMGIDVPADFPDQAVGSLTYALQDGRAPFKPVFPTCSLLRTLARDQPCLDRLYTFAAQA